MTKISFSTIATVRLRGAGLRRMGRDLGALLLLMLAFSGAHAAYQVEIDASAPLDAVLKTHLDLVRFQDRPDVDDDQFRFLVDTVGEQVRRLASTEGYFSSVVTTRVDGEGDSRVVRIVVQAGKRVTIKRLSLVLNGPIETEDPERAERLRQLWSLKPGDDFRQDDWDKAKDDTLRRLQSRRYFAAKLVRSEARVVPESAEVELVAVYDSGPTFTMGPIVVTGLKRYPEFIITRVNPLGLGEQYTSERLLELQRAIQNQPYFANVIIEMEGDPATPLKAPINARITEFPVNRINAGVGYDTNTGGRVEGRYSYFDLFGSAWVLDAQGKIEQFRQFGEVEIAMPPDPKQYRNSAYVSEERTDLEGVDLRSLRTGVRRGRTRGIYETAYTVDFYRDDLRPNSTTRELDKALVPSYAWTRRDVDNPLFPRSGNVINAQIGAAIKGILTDQTFARVYGRIRQYFPIGTRDLIIARVELGGIITKGGRNKVPASLRFRAGGTDSIRGYGYQSLGVQDMSATATSVLPAKFLVTTGLEYQWWFSREWGVATFYDIGTAADNVRDADWFQGVGVGARWRSPVGPVHVDLAYGLHDRQFRPHFSLGIAF